jgi:DNA-binding YbaB/EbfC family protein
MGFNPVEFIKNFKNIQARMAEMQEKLKDLVIEGTAGGDMVKIQINGKMEVLSVYLSSEVVDPNEREMLQDLIRAAYSDAFAKLRDKMKEEFSGLTGGMDLPPGFLGT